MKNILKVISALALIAIVTAPILFCSGRLDLDQNKLWMLIATIVWFGSASLWIGTQKKHKA